MENFFKKFHFYWNFEDYCVFLNLDFGTFWDFWTSFIFWFRFFWLNLAAGSLYNLVLHRIDVDNQLPSRGVIIMWFPLLCCYFLLRTCLSVFNRLKVHGNDNAKARGYDRKHIGTDSGSPNTGKMQKQYVMHAIQSEISPLNKISSNN